MTSIRKAKKLGIYKKSNQDKKLLSDTRKIVREVNKRLRNLESGGEYNSWASKKLFTRLDTKNVKALQTIKRGKIKKVKGKRIKGQRIKTRGEIIGIKIPRNATNTQLIAIQKASSQFVRSKTSTVRGIKRVKRKTIKSIKETLSLKQQQLVTQEDAEFYYDLLEDKDFDTFNDKVGASRMWAFIDTAIEKNYTEETWLDMLENHAITLEDKSMSNRAKALYKKYIKTKNKKSKNKK